MKTGSPESPPDLVRGIGFEDIEEQQGRVADVASEGRLDRGFPASAAVCDENTPDRTIVAPDLSGDDREDDEPPGAEV